MSGYGVPGAVSPGEQAANRIQVPTKLKLELNCNGLRNRDTLSVSDPFVVVYLSDTLTKKLQERAGGDTKLARSLSNKPILEGYKEIGRTEVQKNTLNPSFAQQVEIEYFFEELQTLRFAVFDQDRDTDVLHVQDALGQVLVTVGELVSSSPVWTSALYDNEKDQAAKESGVAEAMQKLNVQKGTPSIKHLTQQSHAKGTLSVRVHEQTETMLAVSLEAAGIELDKKDLFGKSDPYFVLKVAHHTGQHQSVLYQSEFIRNTLNPIWKPMQIRVPEKMLHEPLELSVWDYDELSRPDFIGSVTTTFAKLGAQPAPTLGLINSKKASKKKKYVDSGKFIVRSCLVDDVPTFLQYIRAGLKLNFSIGIDFTASNGSPDSPESLHYMGDPSRPNQYVQALTAVGSVLQDYDSDRAFPALGFGAKLLDGTISFNFCLNGQMNPICIGIDGVLHAYYQALRNVRLAGPTNFAPLIHHMMEITRQGQFSATNQFYNILLIMTDGVITDMENTKEAIVEAATLPMSIVIVGVGDGTTFKAMRELDGDDKRLTTKSGRTAVRDVVQFVPFAQFHGLPPERLAAHLLAEIPTNVVEYLNTVCRIKPAKI